MDSLNVGESIPLTSWWWDENGDGIEPATITLTIDPPTGAQITLNKAQLTGTASTEGSAILDRWSYEQSATIPGVWRYRFEGTIAGDPVVQSGLVVVQVHGDARIGPCEPWATWDQVESLCPTVNLSTLAQGTRDDLLDLATSVLWSLDGRRYPGICQATRRICRTCTRCVTATCCCAPGGAIDLGGRWPVYGVWDVVIDGTTVDSAAYALRDRRYVDRLDGNAWPACASLLDADAFHLTYAYGRRPPVELSHAAALFAAELAKSCVGADGCELPERVTTIVREGVTYTILDSQRFLDEGRTGVYLVDLALKAASAGRKAAPGMQGPR